MNSLLKKIVIGTAQFGLDYGVNNKSGKIPGDEVFIILDLLQASGIEILDTAQAYGDSENILGNYHKKQNKFFQIISKLQDCPPNQVENKVLESLGRLNVRNLYGVLLHSFDTYLKNPQTFKVLASLKKTGIVGKVGFSLYYPHDIDKLLEDDVAFDVIQIPYNLFDRRFEKYFSILKKRKIEVHVRSVFLQGLFFIEPKMLPRNLAEFSKHLTLLNELSVKIGVNVHELALLFVVSNPLVDKAVIGIDNVNHLKDIISVLNDNSKLEIIISRKSVLSELKVENEKILIPSNWK